MIKVVIGEDHQSLIDGLASFFKDDSNIKIIGSALNGEDLLRTVIALRPKVVLMDIRMPKQDGFATTRKIKQRFKSVHVIAFTMFDQPAIVNKMLDAGAIGYILKNSGLKIMTEAIESVAKGIPYFDPNVLVNLEKEKRNQKNQKKGVLSKREKEILTLIGEGLKSTEIAKELNITLNTVNTHRRNIIRKLNLEPNADLRRIAIERKYDF